MLNNEEFMSSYSYVGALMGRHSYWKNQSWWPDRFMDLNFISPFIHMISNHFSYEKYCQENHPGIDKFKCAIVYS